MLAPSRSVVATASALEKQSAIFTSPDRAPVLTSKCGGLRFSNIATAHQIAIKQKDRSSKAPGRIAKLHMLSLAHHAKSETFGYRNRFSGHSE